MPRGADGLCLHVVPRASTSPQRHSSTRATAASSARRRSGEAARRFFAFTPFLLLAGAASLAALRRARGRGPAPTGRALGVLALSLALGPGLLVNAALKDHWHRPRPVQVVAFGGTDAFRPLGPPGGDCARNCSFVSGEGASSFWSVALALMAPPSWRAAALGGALLYAFATGLLRMAFGGHFLSDTLLAALFTWLVVAAVWRCVLGRRRPGCGVTDR